MSVDHKNPTKVVTGVVRLSYDPLPPVRSVCPGPTGGPSSSGSLSMRSGHDVRRLDGWAALPYQNAGCRR